MKKLLLLMIIVPVIVNANPIWLGVNISEIGFNKSGEWTLEIDNGSISSLEYLDSLVLKCNSGRAKIIEFDKTDYIVITNVNLNKAISFNKNADCIKLYSYLHGQFTIDSICMGEMTGSYLKNIENGQSIARLYNYGPFYKDNSPTIGYANDLEGSKGKIYGYIYDTDGELVKNKYFFINEGYCTPILQKQGYAGNIQINGNGFYCAEITSRSYSISESVIYESSTDHELVKFHNVDFELNENDSININFIGVLTSIRAVSKDTDLISSYPNPATNNIYFIISQASISNSPFYITIYNIYGQRIDSFIIPAEQYQWNCSHLPQGTYIYTLSLDNRIMGTNKFQVIK